MTVNRKAKGDYAIGAVSNATRLLQVFREVDEIGVAELARRLGLHKNNVFRLLATLEEAGFIEQNAETGRYRLGLACHFLGQAFGRSRPLLERALPVLDLLLEHTGETIHLAVRDGFEVVHLLARVPERQIVVSPRLGQRAPLHCTALGKVLLGCAPERLWREFDERCAPKGKLPRLTQRGIESRDEFFEHLNKVSGLGWATDVGEFEDGLGCAAAPVYDADGELVAALSVSAPLFRLGDPEGGCAEAIRTQVVEAAGDLSAALGYVP